MNLQSLMEIEAAICRGARLQRQPRWPRFAGIFFRQKAPMSVSFSMFSKSLSFARKAAVCLCLGLFLLIPAAVFAQTNYYTTNGVEYAIVGQLPGDQVWPDVAVNTGGGFEVWQDNATDGSGWGISARRLDSTLSGTLSTFRVNVTGTNDQENAHVALLKNGGAVFVWQGGVEGFQHIFARFLTATNTWLTTTDMVVSVPANNFQVNPSVAVLNNSNVVVVWASYDQASSSSLLDVYGQIISPSGQMIGTNFLINQFIPYNQRKPAVAALAGGGFVVTWVSEQERVLAPNLGNNSTYSSSSGVVRPSVDIYARLFGAGGAPVGNEFLVNADSNPASDPVVAAGSDGGFTIAWDAKDLAVAGNSWDIYARSFTSAAAGGPVLRVNSYLYGDQYLPHISSIGVDYLVAWTSLAQDGSREGVFGRFLNGTGTLVGNEFRVNTTTVGQQMQPAVGSDGANQFLVTWTSFTGSPYNFDLFAQRYININMATNLPAMNAPFVWAPFTLSNGVYQPQLQVSWPLLLGISVSNYLVFADNVTNTPIATVTSNQWTMTAANGLKTNSTHSFQVAYVTITGRLSPLSPSASGTTWIGRSWGGIPYEWMAAYFGGYYGGVYHTNLWPVVGSPVAAGGPTLLQVFVMGGNPYDSTTWLQQTLVQSQQGLFLNWNTQPGHTYQVLTKSSLPGVWTNLGAPRFAAGTSDSIYVGGGPAGYYLIQFLY
jgi:hypothetical protein